MRVDMAIIINEIPRNLFLEDGDGFFNDTQRNILFKQGDLPSFLRVIAEDFENNFASQRNLDADAIPATAYIACYNYLEIFVLVHGGARKLKTANA